MAESSCEIASPKYEEVSKKLVALVNKAVWLSSIRNLFEVFGTRFTIVPSLWLLWIEKEQTSTFPDYIEDEAFFRVSQIKERALCHFYHSSFVKYQYYSHIVSVFVTLNGINRWELIQENKYSRILQWDEFNTLTPLVEDNLKMMEPLLLYPHNKLVKFMALVKERSESPLSKSVDTAYQKAFELFQRIDEVISSPDSCPSEWLAILEETNDKELIMENFEYWIGKSPWKKELWTVYLRFLKKIGDDERALCLCSRYCRMFLEDVEMKKEYSTEIARYRKPRIRKSMGVKIKQGLLPCMGKLIYRPSSAEITASKPITFNQATYYPLKQIPYKELSLRKVTPPVPQKLCLPSTLINYMFKSSNHIALAKLYQTSKHFFFVYKLLLCYRLKLRMEPGGHFKWGYSHFRQDSLDIYSNTANFNGLQKLTVMNSLECRGISTAFTEVLPKITLRIKHFQLVNQTIGLAELEYLKSLMLETLRLHNVTITDDDGRLITMDEIIESLPTVTCMSLIRPHTIFDTSLNLLGLRRHLKFKWFTIEVANENLNIQEFVEFLEKNISKHAVVGVRCIDVADAYKKTFKDEIKKLAARFRCSLRCSPPQF